MRAATFCWIVTCCHSGLPTDMLSSSSGVTRTLSGSTAAAETLALPLLAACLQPATQSSDAAVTTNVNPKHLLRMRVFLIGLPLQVLQDRSGPTDVRRARRE